MGIRSGKRFYSNRSIENQVQHYAKDIENMVTTDETKTFVGNTFWQKQISGEVKSIAFGSRHFGETEK